MSSYFLLTKPFGGGYNILVLIGFKNNSLNSLTNLNKLVSNILVAASFLTLTFLTVKTFAPDISSNADTNTVTAGSSTYSASISTSDATSISINPTDVQTIFTGQNNITYTNQCPHGFIVTLSSASENPSLTRAGNDSATKTIPTISSGNTLADNTWGYSLDNGETYNGVPSISSPATIINTTSSNTDPVSLNLIYGVKTNNSIPAGKYSNDIIYTVAVKPQCLVYDLKWNLNGGTGASGVSYDDAEITYGSTMNLQSYTPTRTGYTFTGWKSSVTGNTFATDSGTIDINPTNAMEVTLTAQWTPVTYTISYTLNGGSATNPTSYNIETNTITLNNPTRNGYTFAGWTGSNGTTKQTTVTIPKGSTGNKSYTANWTPVNYTISYTMNGGACSSYTNNYTIETNTFSLCTPTRNGYTFAGWTGSNGSTKQTSVSIPKGSTGNKSYTANWTPVTYTISYNLNSGSASNPTSYTIESNAITLNNPTRGSYTFTGWSGTGLSGSANKSVTIPKGSTGNRSYTANWQASNISSISTMQAMTSSICSATAVGASKNLTDTRDNNVYTVRKLNDGKCWMVNNLKIINKTISSNDSNLPSGVTWTIPTSNLEAFTGAYNINAVYTESGEVYYSFFTATAGWGMESVTSGNSPRDICPKGWRLPTGGPSGEFQALYNNYSSLALMQGDPGFTLAGNAYYNHLFSKGSAARYWSSTAKTNDHVYDLYMTSSSVAPADSDTKVAGNTIHCVAK